MVQHLEQNPSSSNAKPLVSIGIPVYNGEKFLRKALDSVLTQDYENFEIIISDNASTDHTAEICQSYLGRDKRIKYHRNTSNIGASRNFSDVLKKSNGKYFTWLAHDDLLSSPHYLSKTVDFLETHEDVVLCGSSINAFFDEDSQSTTQYTFEAISEDKKWEQSRLEFFHCPPRIELMIYSIYRTETLKKISFANGTLKHPDFFAYNLILASLCAHGRIVALPEVLRSYRCNLDSISYGVTENNSSLFLFMFMLQTKLSLLIIALKFPTPWREKFELIKLTLCNFKSFARELNVKNELKNLRTEIAMLRKTCTDRQEAIELLNVEMRNRLHMINNLRKQLEQTRS